MSGLTTVAATVIMRVFLAVSQQLMAACSGSAMDNFVSVFVF